MSSTRFLDFQYKLSRESTCEHHLVCFPPRKDSILEPSTDEMKRVFDKFDANRDGKISQQEYKATLKSLAVDGNMAREVSKTFRVVDLDGNGFISFKEFMEALKMDGEIRRADLESAFRVFDKNGDGKTTAEVVQEGYDEEARRKVQPS